MRERSHKFATGHWRNPTLTHYGDTVTSASCIPGGRASTSISAGVGGAAPPRPPGPAERARSMLRERGLLVSRVMARRVLPTFQVAPTRGSLQAPHHPLPTLCDGPLGSRASPCHEHSQKKRMRAMPSRTSGKALFVLVSVLTRPCGSRSRHEQVTASQRVGWVGTQAAIFFSCQ